MSQAKTISSNVLLSSELLSAEDSHGLSIELDERLQLTALEIIGLDLPTRNRVEALLRKEFLEEQQLRDLAFDFAERALRVFELYSPGDPRPRKFMEIARMYYAGQESQEKLKSAFIEMWRAIEGFNGLIYKSAFASGLAVSLLYSGETDIMARDVALWAQNSAHRKQWETRGSDFEPMFGRESEAAWQLKRIAKKFG